MRSRYERYRDKNYSNDSSKRTVRNQEIYDKIYDDVEYSNVEGITSIERSNRVNLNNLRELIDRREESKRDKRYEIVKEKVKVERDDDFFNDDKDYDIRDILAKAKENIKEDDKKRSLDYTKYNIDLTKRRQKKLSSVEDDERELEELIRNFTSTNVKTAHTYDLLEDLRGSEQTKVIASGDAIDKAISEAKQEVDESFYTTSVGLRKEDLEDLKEVSNNMRTNNILVIVILIVLFAVIIGVGIMFAMSTL
jgi:signal recognition particle GTPase